MIKQQLGTDVNTAHYIVKATHQKEVDPTLREVLAEVSEVMKVFNRAVDVRNLTMMVLEMAQMGTIMVKGITHE